MLRYQFWFEVRTDEWWRETEPLFRHVNLAPQVVAVALNTANVGIKSTTEFGLVGFKLQGIQPRLLGHRRLRRSQKSAGDRPKEIANRR